MRPGQSKVTPATEANIRAVAKLERESLAKRSLSDRIGDTIAEFVGSMRFVALHGAVFAVWIAVNTLKLGIPPFDPYPFIFLCMIVSLEGVILSTFVLMKQNRMSQIAEERDHLNLQIDLLAEKQITKVLQMQRMLCDHCGLQHASQDKDAEQLSEETAVEALARKLREDLSNGK